MSRIGRLPVTIPSGVDVTIDGRQVTVKGPKGELSHVVAEPITNKLLISATPRYYPDIMRLIAELDAELPQVVIQVLIAEVQLTNVEEFGVEIGLQSPVLFRRSVYPDARFQGTGFSSSFTNPTNTFAFGTAVVPTEVVIPAWMKPKWLEGEMAGIRVGTRARAEGERKDEAR